VKKTHPSLLELV